MTQSVERNAQPVGQKQSLPRFLLFVTVLMMTSPQISVSAAATQRESFTSIQMKIWILLLPTIASPALRVLSAFPCGSFPSEFLRWVHFEYAFEEASVQVCAFRSRGSLAYPEYEQPPPRSAEDTGFEPCKDCFTTFQAWWGLRSGIGILGVPASKDQWFEDEIREPVKSAEEVQSGPAVLVLGSASIFRCHNRMFNSRLRVKSTPKRRD